ncbi:hypothetical protein LX32DRAFT_709206 [Colletotrichum zoysiae]|uniref:Zn(2)-C6 fungal-type domain-containing protein n=1 Tax=Colletotrichum zoysiae TaxID=1216348 RepID=A0AAD9H635_9PEZI|nr:hypothetical protein LX32DRAFT_709206 [Colletotrichum zoysiae]
MSSDSSSGPTTSFALRQRPRFTRASNPKVRTGCITCRNRRKKCDEGKPACAACLKYQGYCPGYPASKTQAAATAQNRRPIRPKLAAAVADRADADADADGGGPMTMTMTTSRPRYASLVFSDQLERDHFDCWLRLVDSSLLFRNDLLSLVVPQLSWSDPALRHAALAVGAAAFGGATRERRILGNGGAHHLATLTHYGRALRLLSSPPVSAERALVACLLFVLLECLRGRTAAALTHINHGVRIIEHFQRQQRLHHQQQQQHGGPPPPVPLSTGVVDGFRRLSFQSWALNGVRLRETRERVPWCCRGRRARYAVQEMPAVFDTLESAHRWWNQVRHHVEHRAPLRHNFHVKRSSSSSSSSSPSPGAAAAAAAAADHLLRREHGSPEFARRVRAFMHHLDAWAAAFAPLAVRAEAGRAAEPAEYLKALSLRVHYLCLWTGVRSAAWTDAAETARLTPTFRDITALGARFLAAQEQAQAARRRWSDLPGGGGGGQEEEEEEVFTIEDGLTWPLACSYRVCASPEVRRDIVRLFREHPRRDSLLDTRAFLVMMEWADRVASAGIATSGGQDPATDRVVFDGDAVVLQWRLWDPEASGWREKDIRFSIL